MKGRRARSATARLAGTMAADAGALRAELAERPSDRALAAARECLAAELVRKIGAGEAADLLAQAAICAAPLLKNAPATALDWLAPSFNDWQRYALELARSATSAQYEGDASHAYEQFLHAYSPQSRKRHGVFFTPEPIARYIVRNIDQLLVNDFDFPNGLAAQSAIQVLDPACGTGVFLLAVIDHLHRRLGHRWNDFVPDLLPRLVGIELLPVPALLAKINIALKLAETGYDFHEPGIIRIEIGDALSPNPKSEIRKSKSATVVVLGNPPFSSLSTNTNPWIARLVRGDEEVRGYMRAGDQRLGERKTWLHDDYVKFLRLAQWYVEQAGQGIVGFVTNHGYLDNATFRLMRQELLRTFPRIRLVDLHGSRKSGELAPDGSPDENVFGLDQGVAIGLFCRPPASQSPDQWSGCSAGDCSTHVEYSDLWGSRDAKLAALASGGREPPETSDVESQPISFRPLSPEPPHWRLVPTTGPDHPEYARAWSLPDAMPVSTTAPVTARDHFVVAFTAEELHQRIAEFRDLSIPDEVIRERYFTRTRSSRYPRGDTRSWKLGAARIAVATDADWQAKIVRCLYRPFDWRYVFWHPAMIDWPRTEVTKHFVQGTGDRGQGTGNGAPSPQPLAPLCLIARRQQLPAQPCTFFWIADCLALDGVIRSDNRGSESLFPLWLAGADGSPAANFAAAFVEQVAASLGEQPAALDLLAYVYALFHSPNYRERYQGQLRSDFPRVLLPRTGELFGQMAGLGRRLIELHLLRGCQLSHHAGDASIENFRVGGYVVLKKWLQPKHRSRRDPQYQQIAVGIGHTQVLMAAIDAAIARHGGFPAAFA